MFLLIEVSPYKMLTKTASTMMSFHIKVNIYKRMPNNLMSRITNMNMSTFMPLGRLSVMPLMMSCGPLPAVWLALLFVLAIFLWMFSILASSGAFVHVTIPTNVLLFRG